MSRRASLYAKQHPGKPRVRFPDEIVFDDNLKENDLEAVHTMLRRASLQMDINSINTAGLTPLHTAVLDGNFAAVRLLIRHGADINKQDEDTWTALHAACSEGHVDIARYLLKRGADPLIRTDEGERPLDLVDASDFAMIKVMLEATNKAKKDKGIDDDDDDDDDDENDGENDQCCADDGENADGGYEDEDEDESDEEEDYDEETDKSRFLAYRSRHSVPKEPQDDDG
ncbi:protein phosphatase 1 regulatory subunit 27 [Lingula anatina]|uniref:Protein phosphatase 1 regulatory subunit 27 n=1 Tax=Lingula anatina TaxID=7574 RepID=A0A1S3KD94_LINAN|nr:protein phosphatase 1 regulatory subunit 27 [Lingula anatina]XP_013420424.1 protein phosphatase 1 regulatory subunit 27 [Lingula anatina]XP_013420426.1 protein phosphatase 1 regulatory subunit 27 [Lingula anatina]XP_013420427.1 protein phosphatase 1 regulatory subunit 27 [Lingula anatina]XP_013420428.1 protein phosphatase 1 regulatory subunit 27 [Lingula anatina]XP_013420429.1 protein phosphatase 1 regulatory subunit 27 [Lingula anatina]XP_013420430.1 protein phosphatase 1 regulatory subun|eukprot:XP_013420423.1 protein phosphatase 1 regulatory subunit 27 [Lingula anatina]